MKNLIAPEDKLAHPDNQWEWLQRVVDGRLADREERIRQLAVQAANVESGHFHFLDVETHGYISENATVPKADPSRTMADVLIHLRPEARGFERVLLAERLIREAMDVPLP